MTNNLKLRILSKLGFLLVFIGFFMPISCNLNGFEIARTLEVFGGTNLISISLYVIFVGSCVGLFLFLLLIMKIKYSVNYDWLNVLAVIAAFVCFVYLQNESLEGSIFDSFSQLQSGGYLIIIGLIVAFVPLIILSEGGRKNTNKNYSNEKHDTGHRSDIDQSSSLTDNEKIIIDLTAKKPFLTIKYILENTSLDINVIDNILNILVKKRIFNKYDLIKHENGNIYYLENIDINNIDKELLDSEFLCMIKNYHIWDIRNIYRCVSGLNNYYCELYIGKLYYLYINKLGTIDDWNNESVKHINIIKNIENTIPSEKFLMYGFGAIPVIMSFMLLILFDFENFVIPAIFTIVGMIIAAFLGNKVYKMIIKKDIEKINENLKMWLKDDYNTIPLIRGL